MSDDLHNDLFESLFSDRLNEEAKGDSWDIPGDGVWKKIEEEITELPTAETQRKSSLWTWLVLLTVAVIIFLLRTCGPAEKQLVPSLVVQEETVTLPLESKGIKADSKRKIIPAEDLTEEKEFLKNGISESNEREQNVILSLKKKESKSELFSIAPTGTDSKLMLPLDTTNKIVQNQENQQNTQPTLNDNQDAQARTTLSLPAPIPVLSFPILENDHPNLTPVGPPEIKKRTLEKSKGGPRRFMAGIYYAPALSHRSITEPDQLRRRLLDEQEQPGKVLLSGGLRLGYRLAPRWTLETGLQITKTEIQSRHLARLNYNRNQEIQNANGDYDSSYRMTLSTSFGEVATDVAITRNAATTVPANLSTFVVFDLQQNFTQLRIPVTVRYELGNKKLRGSIRSGFAANLLMDKQIQITRIGLNRAGLRHRQTRVVEKFQGLNDKNLDYIIALGLNYSFTPAVSLMLEPSFLQSLTPAFERGSSKTYPNLLSLNIGLNYHF